MLFNYRLQNLSEKTSYYFDANCRLFFEFNITLIKGDRFNSDRASLHCKASKAGDIL